MSFKLYNLKAPDNVWTHRRRTDERSGFVTFNASSDLGQLNKKKFIFKASLSMVVLSRNELKLTPDS